MTLNIPASVRHAVALAFEQSNNAVANALSVQPCYRETDLDLKFIEALFPFGQHSLSVDDWTVCVECIRIGSFGLHGRKEAGDIALVAEYYAGGVLTKRKVVLLQAKKLCVSTIDTEVGILFEYQPWSKYSAYNDTQKQDIDTFMRRHNIPVAYLFYNPWQVPLDVQPPGISDACAFADKLHNRTHNESLSFRQVQTGFKYTGKKRCGCRVVPADHMHATIQRLARDSITFDLVTKVPGFEKGKNRGGWKLEDFVSNTFLPCIIGKEVLNATDELKSFMTALEEVAQRTITAIVLVKLDAPPDFEYELSAE